MPVARGAVAEGDADAVGGQGADQGVGAGEFGGDRCEFDGAEVWAVDGCGRDGGGLEEGGVVGALFGGREVGALDVGAEERRSIGVVAGLEVWEDLLVVRTVCRDEAGYGW